MQKITSVLSKIDKNCCHQSCTFSLQYAPNCLSAAASPQTQLGELTAPRDLLAVFRGPTSKERGGTWGEWRGEEERSSFFALGWKPKSRRLWATAFRLFCVCWKPHGVTFNVCHCLATVSKSYEQCSRIRILRFSDFKKTRFWHFFNWHVKNVLKSIAKV